MTVKRQQNTADARPLTIKNGGEIMLIGLFLLLIGLLMAAGMIFMGIRIPAEEAPLWIRAGLLVLAAIPLAFAALGLLLTFGGERITLDAAARQIHIRYGRWWTWKRQTREFDQFHAVQVHRQSTSIGGRRGGGPTYPVQILSDGDEVELSNNSSYPKARALAEKVANLTGLPFHEATERTTIVRDAGRLDESLAERSRRIGEIAKWPREPEGNRVKVCHLGNETVLDLPRPDRKTVLEGALSLGFLLAIYGGAIYGAAFLLGDGLEKLGINAHQGVWAAVLWAVPVIPIVYILGFGLVLLIARERLTVTARSLKCAWRFPIGAWTRRVAIGDIEELLSDGNDIILRTDRKTRRIGFALNKQERRWLRKALKFLLVRGPGQGPH